ncbi:MAG: hypothetical protein Q7R85_04510 [bacterium]|nr:hypothetical protein [bacterium]
MTFNKNLLTTTLTVFSVLSMTGFSAFAAGPALVNLGASGNFVILAKNRDFNNRNNRHCR